MWIPPCLATKPQSFSHLSEGVWMRRKQLEVRGTHGGRMRHHNWVSGVGEGSLSVSSGAASLEDWGRTDRDDFWLTLPPRPLYKSLHICLKSSKTLLLADGESAVKQVSVATRNCSSDLNFGMVTAFHFSSLRADCWLWDLPPPSTWLRTPHHKPVTDKPQRSWAGSRMEAGAHARLCLGCR